MAPRAICFDLDHTLCRPTQDREVLLERTFSEVGVEPVCRHDELAPLIVDLPPAQTERGFYTNLFASATEASGIDPGLAPSLADAYLDHLDPSAVDFRPGARTALERARERGPVGLITNGGREMQTEKLEALGIADAFDVRVFTDPAAGVDPKPSAAPFERALSALGSDPEHTLHVGDSLHADVAGANAMGMQSAWLANDRQPTPEVEPTYTIASPDEVTRLF